MKKGGKQKNKPKSSPKSAGKQERIESKKLLSSRTVFLLILALGLFARLWRYPAVPTGLNQDEAFAAYDAWALLHFGTDSSMHSWPVYLTAWGSGMNALESYLMLPFLALFGTHKAIFRLPQLLVSVASVFAARGVGRRIAGERCGLCFAALIALCPWHILLSRWGSNPISRPACCCSACCFSCAGKRTAGFSCSPRCFTGSRSTPIRPSGRSCR